MDNRFDFLDLNNSLKTLWKYYLVLGIVFVILGGLSLFNPNIFAMSIVYVIGWLLMFVGIGNIFYAYSSRNNPNAHWGILIFEGILEIISAVLVIINPFYSLFFLVIYLGVFLIFRGFMLIFSRGSSDIETPYLSSIKSMITLNGILDIIFGVLALLTPFFVESVLIYTLAFYILFAGILLIVYAFQIDKAYRHSKN